MISGAVIFFPAPSAGSAANPEGDNKSGPPPKKPSEGKSKNADKTANGNPKGLFGR